MRGFTLIEPLVAATVLAIGMLGHAAMLVHSLQASRLALHRTQAVALAADIAETAVAPTLEDIAKLASIAAIRTALNYFLGKDISEYREAYAAPTPETERPA